MGKLVFEGEEFNIEKGISSVELGDKVGIPFSCTEGNCGTCLVQVTKGMENLGELSEKEKDFGLEENERLFCQTVIKGGEVQVEL